MRGHGRTSFYLFGIGSSASALLVPNLPFDLAERGSLDACLTSLFPQPDLTWQQRWDKHAAVLVGEVRQRYGVAAADPVLSSERRG